MIHPNDCKSIKASLFPDEEDKGYIKQFMNGLSLRKVISQFSRINGGGGKTSYLVQHLWCLDVLIPLFLRSWLPQDPNI